MGKLSAENAQLLLTHNVIPPHTLAAVTDQALAACVPGDEAAGRGASLRRLRRIVRRTVAVPGYADAWDAPADALRTAVLDAATRSGALFRALLRVWAGAQSALRLRVEGYLEENAATGEHLTSAWTPERMRAAIAEIRRRDPDLAHNDVALMICWLADYVPLPASSSEGAAPSERAGLDGYVPRWEPLDAEPPRTMRPDGVVHWQIIFREVLDGLRQLAADSAVWAAAGRFAESLRELIDEKGAERTTARAGLQDAIDGLVDEVGADLQFFGFDEVRTWQPERVPLDRVPDLSARVGRLRQTLQHHRALRGAPSDTVTEQLTQRLRLQTLESEAFEIYGRLCAVLSEPQAPEPVQGPRDVAATPPAPVSSETAPETGPAPEAQMMGPLPQPAPVPERVVDEPVAAVMAETPVVPLDGTPVGAQEPADTLPQSPAQAAAGAAAPSDVAASSDAAAMPWPFSAAPPPAVDSASAAPEAVREGAAAAPAPPGPAEYAPPDATHDATSTHIVMETVEQERHPTADDVASPPPGDAPAPDADRPSVPVGGALPAAESATRASAGAGSGAWFADLAHWEPLPRERRVASPPRQPPPRRGLRGLLARIVAFLGG